MLLAWTFVAATIELTLWVFLTAADSSWAAFPADAAVLSAPCPLDEHPLTATATIAASTAAARTAPKRDCTNPPVRHWSTLTWLDRLRGSL
jgi:hypothetical protein